MAQIDHTDDGVSLAPDALRRKLLAVALRAPEFGDRLAAAAAEIRNAAKPEATEATIESHFERVVYAILKDIGLQFNPKKEASVVLPRHVIKGRMDTRLGALVIEYKRPSLLKTQQQMEVALKQLEGYITSLSAESDSPFVGILTNGLLIVERRAVRGAIVERAVAEPLSGDSLRRLTQHVISLALTALTPANLIRDFCGSTEHGAVFCMARILDKILASRQHPKTAMLRSEWEALFQLSHNDRSQQRKIRDRKEALASLFGTTITENDSASEYRTLFALHTAYAILLKFIAYRTVSDIYLGSPTQDFKSLASADSDSLRVFCADLEDGAIFRSLGILNLLEGDFFSWYSDEQQWDSLLAASIQQLMATLAKYEEAKNIFTSEDVPDLFRELYQATVPKAVRSSFGEVYTPYWLAEHVLESTGQTHDWRVLDPCCGSGTFVVAAITKVRKESGGALAATVRNDVLSRVCAIDLHPLAVLTTRIQYFIHISPFLEDDHDEFVIPVYLGDASAVPERVVIGGVKCIRYELKTTKTPIDCALPESLVRDTAKFAKLMYEYEHRIKEQDRQGAIKLLGESIADSEYNSEIGEAIARLTDCLITLERNGWNGIWARILSNFLTTACIGKFTAVVGNPPWIDWKNLPPSYKARIKQTVVEPELFSGAGRTGGINLNVCALITYVSLVNWLDDRGRLAFLMPRELSNQASYEGWRRLGSAGWGFLAFHDWTKAGHPFDPVREDFMTFIVGRRSNSKTVPVRRFFKKPGVAISTLHSLRDAKEHIGYTDHVAGQIIPDSTAFTVADCMGELAEFSLVAGECSYIGREGVQFYPQEMHLFTFLSSGPKSGTAWLKNIQVDKALHSVSSRKQLLETRYLRPVVTGPSIAPFRFRYQGIVAAYPYVASNPQKPVDAMTLSTTSGLLYKFYQQHRHHFENRSSFNDKILGNDPGEFYALPRSGPYRFADTYVAFRKDSNWCAVVVSAVEMPWGGNSPVVFQSHAVSMCERLDNEFITSDEAHYICAILNTPTVGRFIRASSDNRSFKVRPPVFVPRFDEDDQDHKALVEASKRAHADPDKSLKWMRSAETAYLNICRRMRLAAFHELAGQWNDETGYLSMIRRKVEHPAYQKIIAMGQKVVPLILRELEVRPAHWFHALRSITGVDHPSESPVRDALSARDAWLRWGRANGYVLPSA